MVPTESQLSLKLWISESDEHCFIECLDVDIGPISTVMSLRMVGALACRMRAWIQLLYAYDDHMHR